MDPFSSFDNNERVLVVAAHPDDEVLGCGGTIARLTEERDVTVAILGEGLTSRSGAAPSTEDLESLRETGKIANAILGVSDIRYEGLPDNSFDSVPILSVVKVVEQLIDALEPSIVFTHHPGDLNVDHQLTFRSVLTATRPLAGHPVRALISFEIPSSSEWGFQRLEPVFRPNLFMDIDAQLKRKIDAMETYKSEARKAPHPRSPESLRAIAARWGSVVGTTYAEAFEIVRWIA